MKAKRLLATIALVASYAGAAATCFAQAPCLLYEPEIVALTGTVSRGMAYGPPGYGETPKIDRQETYYFLATDRPFCVLAGDDADQPAERSIRQVQLVFGDIPYDRSLPGRRAQIIGTLFHAETGHHHTKVLLTVKAIRAP